ncbi:MAG: winged helix-turn-helix transcriptional regulator [Burkholderiales bacterium]
MKVVGGRWKANILASLLDGSHRFNELCRKGRGVLAAVTHFPQWFTPL